MKRRPFWIRQIERAWVKRPIVWLSGVRRVGKTTLAKMFEDAIYLNCDLPYMIRMLSDSQTMGVFCFEARRETANVKRKTYMNLI